MKEILEETAELFGLRKTVRPDGYTFWRESKDVLENGFREALYPNDIKIIASTLGMGAMILDLGNIDYTTGSLQNDTMNKSMWLLNGKRIDISMDTNGGIIASVTNEPDVNKPAPAFIDRRLQKATGIKKCLHPECKEMVDVSKKKSGCCSKQHMNFECNHPTCLTRAEVNGWSKATHPFGTKIASEHWQYRKIK